MDTLDLASYLSDSTSVVEVHWLPIRLTDSEAKKSHDWISVEWDPSKMPVLTIPSSTQEFVEYTHRDITYTYDMSNDGQRAFRRHFITDALQERMYLVAMDEETLPIHSFPCVDEIQDRSRIVRVGYRLSNRMWIYHDKVWQGNTNQEQAPIHTWCIRYNHAARVDVKRAGTDFFRALNLLRRGTPR